MNTNREEETKFVQDAMNNDRPATYEEVERYKLNLYNHMRSVVEANDSKYGWKKDSGNYRSWKLGMRSLKETYKLEIEE